MESALRLSIVRISSLDPRDVPETKILSPIFNFYGESTSELTESYFVPFSAEADNFTMLLVGSPYALSVPMSKV